ncbi:hypothetical protein HMI55_001655 [Coelomomyces lativittatus]|nr:hypothetical protein HMI55_001655 [Coelomomyces lativittatus]
MAKETNGDQKRPDGKQLTRTYYALDYKLFADVIKWKLLKIDKHIRARMEREMDHRGYVCPECQTKYSALEAMRHCEQFLNDEGQMDFRFVCKIDHILLEEDQHTDALQHGNLVLEELYTQNQKIMDLIRECDQVKLPKYIVMEPPTSVKKFKFDDSLGGTGKGDGGNPSPSHSLPHQHAVKVEFVKETQAPEALPIWHRQSTVIQPLITSHVPDSVPSLTSLQKPTEDTQGVDEYYKTYLTEYSHHHVDLHRSHHPSSTDPIKRSPTLGSQQVEMNEEKEEDGEDVFTDEEFEDPLESIGMELNTTKNQFIVSESTTETLMYEEVNLHLPSESSKEIENSKEEEEEDEEFEFVEIFPS